MGRPEVLRPYTPMHRPTTNWTDKSPPSGELGRADERDSPSATPSSRREAAEAHAAASQPGENAASPATPPTQPRAKRDWAAPPGRVTQGVVAQFARAMALQEMQEIAQKKDFEKERLARASKPPAANEGDAHLAALSVVVGEAGGETLAAALLRVRKEKGPVAASLTEKAPLVLCGRHLKIMADPNGASDRPPVLTLSGSSPIGMALGDAASDVRIVGLDIRQSADARPALREIQVHAKPLVHAPSSAHAFTIPGFASSGPAAGPKP
ncbi:hypothetical protein T484DRAFT_1896912 [Baffinella frigidus]|nr:hypothetical protein T484DRAFT_1896912 [Cryptophyta sp. CCMP2293]